MLIDCYIIGANDPPPVHDMNDRLDDEDFDKNGNIADEDLTPEQLKERKEAYKNYTILGIPRVNQKNYQLYINIVRGDSFPNIGGAGIKGLISCKVANSILISKVQERTQKPKFSTRMKFPISFPLLNDKIVMKAWNINDFSPDQFIANIPENPFIDNWFNINFLQSGGGNLPFTWINLYGIPFEEREGLMSALNIFKKKKKYVEGTDFLGRVLISMNLTPVKSPERGISYLGGYKEPESIQYTLIVDVIELQLYTKKTKVKVEVKFGGKSPVESAEQNCDSETKNNEIKNFRWRGKKTLVDQISDQFPIDSNQVPDIFLNIISDVERLAYIRIPASSNEILDSNRPNWFEMKSPEDNSSPISNSNFLANVRLIRGGDKNIPRSAYTIEHNTHVNLYIYLYSCIELEPERYSEDIQAKVEFQFGQILPNHKNMTVETEHKTKNPIFGARNQVGIFEGHFIHAHTKISGDLDLAPSLFVTVKNKLNQGFMSLGDDMIGRVTIHPKNAMKLKSKGTQEQHEPKFFTLKRNGKITGKILLFFGLTKGKQETINMDKFKKKFECSWKKYDLRMSCLGIRNLDVDMINPSIQFAIPSYEICHQYVPETNEETDKKTKKIAKYLYDSRINVYFFYLIIGRSYEQT